MPGHGGQNTREAAIPGLHGLALLGSVLRAMQATEAAAALPAPSTLTQHSTRRTSSRWSASA
eukprot:8030831-Alexandrium_andersonii.AAC.1